MDGLLVALGWRPTETPLALIGARPVVAAIAAGLGFVVLEAVKAIVRGTLP